MKNRIYSLYQKLLNQYDQPVGYWPNWCARNKTLKQKEIIIISAVLTQRTTWHNAELALKNLDRIDVLSIKKIVGLKEKFLAKLIKPAGFYIVKSKRLKDLCSFLIKDYAGLKGFLKEDLIVARKKLLSLYGIGPETADSILLYGCDKPSFVIDEYTRRWVKKHRLAKNLTYDYLKNLFEKNLPKDYRLYQDFHALIIIDQKGAEKSKMAKF
ncbi:MAG: endonuclease [Patescibacteria group bacterium]